MSSFLAGEEGLDSHACGRLVVGGRNRPPEGCSVPPLLQVFLSVFQKKKRHPDGCLPFWQGQKDLNPRHAVLENFQKRIIVHYVVLFSVNIV